MTKLTLALRGGNLNNGRHVLSITALSSLMLSSFEEETPPAKIRKIEHEEHVWAEDNLFRAVLNASKTPTAIFSRDSDGSSLTICFTNQSFITQTQWRDKIDDKTRQRPTVGLPKDKRFIRPTDAEGRLHEQWWVSAFTVLDNATSRRQRFYSVLKDSHLLIEAEFEPLQMGGRTFCIVTCTLYPHQFPIRPETEPLPIDVQEFHRDSVIATGDFRQTLEINGKASDVRVLHVTESISKYYHNTTPEVMQKKWMVREFGLSKEKVEWYTDNFLSIAKIGERRQLNSCIYFPRTGSYKDTIGVAICLGAFDNVNQIMLTPEEIPHCNDVSYIFQYALEKGTESTMESKAAYNTDYAAFFNIAPTPMGVVEILDNNATLHFHLANRALSQTFYQLEPDAIVGKISRELHREIPSEEYQTWVNSMRAHWNEEENISHFEHKPQGNVITYQCIAKKMERDIWAFVQIDITSIKDAQNMLEGQVKERTEQLSRALEIKSRFLATMSHGDEISPRFTVSLYVEIRTPIAGIVGSLSQLEDQDMSEEKKEMIRISLVCGKQLLMITNDVLDISKMETGNLVLENQVFRVQDVVEDCIDQVHYQAQEKKLRLICNINTPFNLRVSADECRLRQVITNLLSNAVKFTAEGEIELSVGMMEEKSEGIRLEFSVRDTGPGLAEEFKAQIFRPFCQGDTSITRRYGGTGLGLSICHRICHLMGGDIKYRRNEDGGAWFHFHVLVAPVHTRLENSSDLLLPGIAFKALTEMNALKLTMKQKAMKRLVVVDENESQRINLTNFLREMGFDCTNFPSFSCIPIEEHRTQPVDMYMSSGSANETSISGTCETPVFCMTQVKRDIIVLQLDKTFLAGKHQKAGEKMKQKKIGGDLAGLRVLLAEDNEMNQRIFRRMLTNMKTELTVVDNGKKAVDHVNEHHYDIILLDCMMPVMGGVEAMRHIRELVKNRKERPIVLALTADILPENRKNCLEAGMDDVLYKPITQKQLQDALVSYVQKQPA
ncbi:PAS/PAC sensor hybrid histidine kinase [Planoprotostelium fungivorum]|uniref:PAS/PAC sensor hybrid histidine kinase n=1 Tax=Planoprotostelium fungivorum TaxID=1890364 RepID=A0A2P6NZ52_9EUKA|nr:PAS/PAC sensor hybrid histidine kinase [Planoprotostelium fungivorum]